MTLQFWQMGAQTLPSKLHWMYTHVIPRLQRRDRILPPRPFQLLQLVHVKLPLIICWDNCCQREQRNRTSDNYRVWAGDGCTADKKYLKYKTVQNPTGCNFPKSKAMAALFLLGWPLLDVCLQRLGQRIHSFTDTTGRMVPAKIFVLAGRLNLQGKNRGCS